MARQYWFEKVETLARHPKYPDCWEGEIQNLSEVDEIICAYEGNEPDDKRFCPTYDYLVEVAFTALVCIGGSYIEQRHVDWIIEKSPQDARVQARFERLLRWVFLAQWRFQARG